MNQAKMTIKEIEGIFASETIAPESIAMLRADARPAVARLIKRWEKTQQELDRVRALYFYEDLYYKTGAERIAGVDEAGRGPLAGPVSVAAVILPPHFYLAKINDSKKLSAKVREALYETITAQAIAVAHVFIEPETIDRINIYQATVQGMYQALQSLRPAPEAALIDAVPLERLTIPSQSLIKGDALSASIAAASVIAKVKRDRLMDEWELRYPGYGFAQHKGYGTAQHLEAIRRLGPCPIHRKSFEPIKSWRK